MDGCMEFVGFWAYLIGGIAIVLVIAIGLGVTLVRGGRQGRSERAARSAGGAVSTPPPAAEAAPGTTAPDGPSLGRPEGTASRLVRLRARLAGSQGARGKGLLALLSRERLDEDTWEDIEDTLLTADVGVAPTRELVEKLRTRLRVEGGESASPREVLRE